jgi:hypothetical protein
MELHSKKEVYKMNTAPAEPLAQNDTYFVSREEITHNGKVTTVWYGYATNWKCADGAWSMLTNGNFEPCEEPIYEKLRREL